MKIAILGFGNQGRAAYDYWRAGHELTVCDQNVDPDVALPEDVARRLGNEYLHNLDEFDLIVRSPGVHPNDIVAANSADILEKVTSVTNEFFRVCPSKNVVGVTGTKGKGTTSTLIAKMLEANGKRVHLGGNIGVPPLDMLKNDIRPDDWVVLELANFQLIDLKASPHVAVCLMVVPEHLDWHKNVDEYVATKQQLFRWQTSEDIAVYYGQNEYSKQVVGISEAQKVPYFQPPGAYVDHGEIIIDGRTICRTDELKLLGTHNWQNVCAAVTAVWQITQDAQALRSVLASFSGLPHRLEFVREVDGVQYYDDSFGTAPETAIVALEAFPEPKVIILGGSDKGADYGALAKGVATSNVRRAVLIGQQAARIKEALEDAGFTATVPCGQTMTEIVQTARQLARPGDVILLSTACASFDMFKNYKDRGEQFKAAVNALQ
jgi:UDP-N-acetylmuramoylalanine--D-glutamate ligase